MVVWSTCFVYLFILFTQFTPRHTKIRGLFSICKIRKVNVTVIGKIMNVGQWQLPKSNIKELWTVKIIALNR